ncbi:MAG: hypothetical protein O7G13_14450 [Alphaproteobacteria bacterium]|nr:hypothetical protein [Alphaproteobacteria bacterium]
MALPPPHRRQGGLPIDEPVIIDGPAVPISERLEHHGASETGLVPVQDLLGPGL